MARLIFKHVIDHSFLKHGFVISQEDLKREKETILKLHADGRRIQIIIDGQKHSARVDRIKERNNYFRLMFSANAKEAFLNKYAHIYSIGANGRYIINPGIHIEVGFFETDDEYVCEAREIGEAEKRAIVIDPEEMKAKYQQHLDSLKGKYAGYANAIDRDFIKDLVTREFGKQSAYELTNPKDIEHLVTTIRNDSDLYEKDGKVQRHCPSCSLRKYAKFLRTFAPSKEDIDENIISDIISDIEETGLIFDPKFLSRYICALLTKPFVILSGLTGSGKTSLAMQLPKLICQSESQYKVIPVGADWTNREVLLGYPNAICKGEYVMPDNQALKLILEAIENPEIPYFLILDEMNMSHVERYFADFLSAMESGESIPLWDKGNDEVPSSIKLPKNLFIIGTINVDETTYMFSPKVLDRANVIEFRISPEQMGTFFNSTREITEIYPNPEYASSFLEIASSKHFGDLKSEMKETLMNIFITLGRIQKEFGYRTASEMSRFISIAQKYAGFTDDEVIDTAIVQKLLPKIHGSRKKVNPILKTLWDISCGNAETDIDSVTESPSPKGKRYPLTAEKVWRMYMMAQDNGFTSFAEA